MRFDREIYAPPLSYQNFYKKFRSNEQNTSLPSNFNVCL